MFEDLYQSIKQRYGAGSSSQPMSEWICNNTTIKRSTPFSFKGYEFQRAIIDDMHPDLSCIKCSQVGLALELSTPIATPEGWTTMGEIRVGDTVFDDQGQPTTVTYVSPVWLDRECFEVEFDDGEVIVADAEHRWFVNSHKPFNEHGLHDKFGPPARGSGYAKEGVLTTATIAKKVKHEGRYVYTIPNTKPLNGSGQIPLDPYLLGLWLGDGTLRECRLTTHEDDLRFYEQELTRRDIRLEVIQRRDSTLQVRFYPSSLSGSCRGRGRVHPFAETLKELGLLYRKKFIPTQYLRAAKADRWDLLRGLMDTDGCIDASGNAIFVNTSRDLIEGVAELVTSLGLRARVKWRHEEPRHISGYDVVPQAIGRVSFTAYADTPPVLLPRKALRLRERSSGQLKKTQHRRIVAVRPTAAVPTRCIQVDAPSHLFLAGRGMIPTHNTEVQLRKYLGMLTRNDGTSGIFSLPNDDMFKRVYKTRLKPIMDRDEIFNPPTDTKPIRSTGLVQIRDSFGYITGCGEDDATSIPADFLMHDEVDLSPEEMLVLYQSRLQNSSMRITQKFSTPTFQGFGIDKDYKLTDQREYVIRCASCNHWQIPLFNRKFVHCPEFDQLDMAEFTDLTAEIIASMDFSETYVMCERCRKPLDLANPSLREWVASYPSRDNFRGYYVRPFSAGRLSPAYIFGQLAKYQKDGFIRRFYNTVLGQPYNSANSQVQREDVEACMKGGEIPDVGSTPCFLGIDVGFTCHITVSHDDENGLPVWDLFESVPYARLETRVAELRKVFNIVQGAIDRFPFEPTAAALRDFTAGLIMPIQWRGTAAVQPHKDELGILTHYSANPTMCFDRLHAAFSQRKMVIRGYTHFRETLITHVCDMVRDESPDASAEATWKKTSGNDHYFHAMAFNLLARRICEHMYHTQNGTPGFSASIGGVTIGGPTKLQGLVAAPTDSKKQLRISRLG